MKANSLLLVMNDVAKNPIRRKLHQLGYRLREAGSVCEAMNKIASKLPTLVVMEERINEPEDGLSFVETMSLKFPVLVLFEEEPAIRLPGVAYSSKTASCNDLWKSVTEALSYFFD